MKDTFFSQPKCDRCGKEIRDARTMSWFTEETICLKCSNKEQEIKKSLKKEGMNETFEGCGYIPEV